MSFHVLSLSMGKSVMLGYAWLPEFFYEEKRGNWIARRYTPARATIHEPKQVAALGLLGTMPCI